MSSPFSAPNVDVAPGERVEAAPGESAEATPGERAEAAPGERADAVSALFSVDRPASAVSLDDFSVSTITTTIDLKTRAK